jgi:signal peptidase
MVVVESQSMMHEEEGSIGAIDPGDLILVMNKDRVDIVSFAEAIEEGNENYGHESHGMPGDVIIYRKNGGLDTPVIHRAILEVVPNGTGWDVPGTTLRNVGTVSLTLDYECSYHGGTYNLRIEGWEPEHSGFLTSGDNNFGGCMIDQPAANSQGPGGGLVDASGNPVLPIKDDWIVGVASSEVPWIGAIKLVTSGTSGSVTAKSWYSLTTTILLILLSPLAVERLPEWNSNPDEEE